MHPEILQLAATYDDGINCFDCLVLACSLDGERYLILDIDEGQKGWTSSHLVDY